MADDHVSKKALIKRLNRIEGQIRGVKRMIEEERDCESVMTQLSAVRSAVDGVGALLLVDFIQSSIHKREYSENMDMDSQISRAVFVWGRVHPV